MGPAGGLGRLVGWVTGVGPGSGMALLFVGGGAVASAIGLGAHAIPAVPEVEKLLPDHDLAEVQPAPAMEIRWTRRRRVAVALGALVLAAMIVGLGWLQVVAMSS